MCRLTIAEVVSVCDLVAFRNALYRLILTRCKGRIFGKPANTMSHPSNGADTHPPSGHAEGRG